MPTVQYAKVALGIGKLWIFFNRLFEVCFRFGGFALGSIEQAQLVLRQA